jgi:CRP-like cAMP-binding protein
MKKNTREILTELFEEKNKKIIECFYNVFREKDFRKGQKIYSQGDHAREVYALYQGEVQMFRSER